MNKFSLKEFIRLELGGWKNIEIISLLLVFSVIFFSAFVMKDSAIAVISAICGILYTVMAGKGKISCYLFGLCGSGCYAYLAFANALYGNLALYLFYYIPMEIIGVFKWKNNLNKKTNEIIKTCLPKQKRLHLMLVTVLLSICVILLLKYFNDAQPVKDGITTVFSVVGMYLTVKRCIEQWIVWIVVNGLSLIMWINAVLHGAKTYATVIMWAFYFVAAIYFYYVWKKEIKLTGTNLK